MLLLQSNVLGGNKLNCFKATQVLGGPTQILILESEIAKGPIRSIKGGPGALVSRGGGPMNPNDAMFHLFYHCEKWPFMKEIDLVVDLSDFQG